MKLRVFDDEMAAGRAAAIQAATSLREAIRERGRARMLLAAEPSLVGVLDALVEQRGVAWGEVEMFHVAEYIGLGIDHPASLRKFLFDHLIGRARLGRYHLLDGRNDPERACREEGEQLRALRVDVALIGMGGNGRLAFNDPPADFATEKPYLIVRLEEQYRRGQLNGHAFRILAEVPERAISISIRQLLKANTIVCAASGAERAGAVKRCVEGPVSPLAPASVLRTHPDATVYLDRESAALLKGSGNCGFPIEGRA